jgi:hypothetical protein
MTKPGPNEVQLSTAKHALKDPHMAEARIRRAIQELPADERDAAGGLRNVGAGERSMAQEFYVNKDFLAQLVLDGVVKTHGENAGKFVGDLIADAGLASKLPRGR